jgi:hypothetical protein
LKPVIVVFDVDGVLVNPIGYRLGFQKTICHYLEQMAQPCVFPSEEISELFEAHSANSEWDMVPISLAIILEAELEQICCKRVPHSLESTLQVVKGKHQGKIEVNFADMLDRLSPTFKNAVVPSQGLLKALEDHPGSLLPILGKTALIRSLLGNTRDFNRCLPNRTFENFVHGADFEKYFGPAVIQGLGPSLLEKDIPLLSAEACGRLRDLYRHKGVRFSAVTYRPSLPPLGVTTRARGYPPEAEIALASVGVDFMTVMGFGRIRYLAQQMRVPAENLSKPSPIQALAGIAASWNQEEWPAMVWAYHTVNGTEESIEAKGQEVAQLLPSSFQLHVFEDTIGGILAVQSVSRILKKMGHEIELCIWGIARSQAKASSLRKAGARVFHDVNTAVDHFAKSLQKL